MNVSLTPTLEKFVRDMVASGLYKSNSEVMCEALRLLQQKDTEQQQLFNALDIGYTSYLKGKHSKTTAKNILDKVFSERQDIK